MKCEHGVEKVILSERKGKRITMRVVQVDCQSCKDEDERRFNEFENMNLFEDFETLN